MGAPLIPGIPFDFGGGRVFVIPPLALGDLEALQDRIDALPNLAALSVEAAGTIIDIVHLALSRNYDLTRKQVGEMLDLGNMFEAWSATMDVTGVRRKELEAAGGLGNVTGVGASTGAPSTPE